MLPKKLERLTAKMDTVIVISFAMPRKSRMALMGSFIITFQFGGASDVML